MTIGGRPRKHSPRAKRVAVHLEPKELRAVSKAAAIMGDTLPDFCRRAILAQVERISLDDQS